MKPGLSRPDEILVAIFYVSFVLVVGLVLLQGIFLIVFIFLAVFYVSFVLLAGVVLLQVRVGGGWGGVGWGCV
jgi:hypothetical protein